MSHLALWPAQEPCGSYEKVGSTTADRASGMGGLPRGTSVALVVTVLALAAGLRFSRIDDFHNLYYTATVSSMLHSPSNFLYGSFDPGGVIMVDKPPAAFWVQAASAALFGVRRWAVNLPQAIMGTLAVLLLWLAVAPRFGRLAALSGALCLVVAPSAVLVDGRNEPDTLVMFALTAAALCLVRAMGTSRTRWLVASGVLVGIAFNAKMLVAFVPLPAFYAYYFLRARGNARSVAAKAALMLASTLVVSLIWIAVVALTPAQDRPYVGSTPDNSIWTLTVKYNALDRFTGFKRPFPVQADSGVLALLKNPLAGQLGWLLPLGLIALLVGAARSFASWSNAQPARLLRSRGPPALAEMVLWGGWLATAVMVFGLAQATGSHAYYLVGLAVPLSAVVGIGLSVLWESFRRGGAAAVALPVALGGAAAYQAYFSRGHVADWTTILLAVATAASALIMLGAVWRRRTVTPPAVSAAGIAAAVLIVVPLVYGASLGRGIAGPAVGLPGGSQPEVPHDMVSTFLAGRGETGTAFVVATVDARQAAGFILSGVPALAIGGFTGWDPVFSVDSFRAFVERGQLCYFRMPPLGAGAGVPPAPFGSSEPGPPQWEILKYVRSEWRDVSGEAGLLPGTLYLFPDANGVTPNSV